MRQIVLPEEFAILVKMSNDWCEAMRGEMDNARQELEAENKAKHGRK